MVHKRIGVEPKLYLSAVLTLKNVVISKLSSALERQEVLIPTLMALDKLLYFDTTLVFDTYIGSLVGEIEAAKNRTEIYAASLEEKVAERTKQLEEQARLDPLTNIYNQRAMHEFLRREISFARRRKNKLSLIYFDIDGFKKINDQYGHIKGDEVLRSLGEFMTQSIRETDVPCRYGGDEFCIILSECDIECAKGVCEKIINRFSDKYSSYFLSMGISETGADIYCNGNELIALADKKMYLAKEEDGFQIRF